MKLLTLLLLSLPLTLSAQENKSMAFDSQILSETRNINIHVPASYQDSDKFYPVIYALDGEYAKLTLNGLVDYYSFWDKTPECIVVSIDQNYMDTSVNRYKRWVDCDYSWKTGLPIKKGLTFKDFISKELIPYIDSTYRTTNFRTIVGHSFTANFVNYFLLDKEPLFTGYVAISPYYASNGLDSIQSIIQNLKKPIFYFVASGEKDLSGHIKSVGEFDKRFAKIDNENFVYAKFNMQNNQATHYTIYPIAMPFAIEHLFAAYTAINDNEFDKILKTADKLGYLLTRYENMKAIYGVEVPMREMDLNSVAYAISEKKQWNQLKEIAALSIKIYPESYLGYWTMGEYFEKTADYPSALQQYELGMTKLGEDVLNVSDFQVDVDRVKKKIK